MASRSAFTISAPIVAPSHESNIPSASSSQCNSLNTTSESVGLSNLRLGSNGSEPNTPTTQHSNAQGPQPGDRDSTWRLIIEPVGYGMRPDEGMPRIILNCIRAHYNGLYPSWSEIPINAQGQMFNEFKKYYVWAREHEEKIQGNFKMKARKALARTFCDCRRYNRIPRFVTPELWAKLQEHWNTSEKFKMRSNIGKKARASEKGGSLHTDGAISLLTRKSRMEKELGRPVAHEEVFKDTHVKKNTNTGEETWIEPRAQETYDYRSTLPPGSQDTPLTLNLTEQLWRESADEPVRGVVYGYAEKAYQEKKAWFCCSSSSDIDGVDRVTMSKMKDKIFLLTAELAAASEREKKRDVELAERERQRDEKNATSKKEEEKRYATLQAQLKALFDSGKIIPSCPSESSEERDGYEESDGCEE